MDLTFRPLDNSVKRDRFDCGIPELNDYLHKYARQIQTKGIAKTIVALTENSETPIAGYYAISMAELQNESLPEIDRKKLPRYPIPAAFYLKYGFIALPEQPLTLFLPIATIEKMFK